MPLTLASRIGPDTLGKLEQAARRRYAEARRLMPDEPLGAIYLFGCTIEMRLKAAYYHLAGLAPTSLLAPPAGPTPRAIAEGKIKALLGPGGGAVGHNLYGWAQLVDQTRASLSVPAPVPAQLLAAMHFHVKRASRCWTEVLRYRAARPYDEEMQAVFAAAGWFRLNYRRLWR